jgi:MFS family permease
MVLLASINAFGFIDRVIIALVAEKIKAEFFLSDLQIGLLGGTAFAVVNAFASVPIARMAERFSRATVTAGFLLLASLFTALAGVTTSFLQLLACRVGMAASCAATEAPPHSMISDMYPRKAHRPSRSSCSACRSRRCWARSWGAIAEYFGWRNVRILWRAGTAIALAALLLPRIGSARHRVRRQSPGRGRCSVSCAPAGSALRDDRCFLYQPRHLRGEQLHASVLLPGFADAAGGSALRSGLRYRLTPGTLVGGYGSERLAKLDRRWLWAFLRWGWCWVRRCSMLGLATIAADRGR